MKRITALLLMLCMVLGMTACAQPAQETTPSTAGTTAPVVYNPLTAEEAMKEMKIGWNLGNTFDAPEGETAWGNPFTTREMIEKIHELGFNTIRIPISWGKHVTPAPEYKINENWMNRVQTVVDYAIDCGMYVIINSHHDNEIYLPVESNRENAKTYIGAVWAQIAEHFKDYDHHLIFQTMNEPRVTGTSYEWHVDVKNEACLTAVDIINELNQTALDAIRATGSRNSDRFVIVCGYAGNNFSSQIPQFVMPTDSVEGKLILSVHAYNPYDLCLNVNSPVDTYSRAMASEFTGFMKSLNIRYVKKGIPVIIDEMGCINKDNPEARYEWAKAYVAAAKQYGMVCVWWDNGIVTGSGERFGLLDRRTLTVSPESQSVYEGLMAGLAEE